MRIRTKLFIIFFGLAVLPVLFVGIYFHVVSQNALEDQAISAMVTAVEQAENSVLNYFDIQRAAAMSWASDGFIRTEFEWILGAIDGPNQLEVESRIADLGVYIQENKHVINHDVILTDLFSPDGQVIVSTDPGRDELFELTPEIISQDYYTPDIFESEIGFSILSRIFLEDEAGHPNTPVFHVSSPLVSRTTGEVIGVFVNHITTERISSTLTGEIQDSEPGKLERPEFEYETLEIFMINADGEILTEIHHTLDTEKPTSLANKLADDCFNYSQESQDNYLNHNDEKVIAASACQQGLSWGLLAEITQDEIIAPLRVIRNRVAAILILIAIIAILIANLFSENLNQRILKSLHALKQIGGGDFKVQLSVKGKDEISQISMGIQDMAKALNQSESRYRQIIESVDEVVYSITINPQDFLASQVEFVSAQSNEILGVSNKELKQDIKHWFKNIQEEDQEKVLSQIHTLIQTKEKISMVYTYTHARSSKKIWLYDVMVPIFDDDKKVIGIQGALRDISELKEKEEEIQKASHSLEESESRFFEAFNTSAVGMALVSPEGKWLQVNNALTDLLGYSKEELKNLTFQEVTHPDDLEKDLANAKRLLSGEINTFQMEKRYLKKDKTPVWTLLSVSVVKDANGKPKYLVAQIQDITARIDAEQQRVALDEVKNKFIRIVSHQLRTPLTSISWNLASIIGGEMGDLSESQKEFLTATQKANKIIISRLGDLLIALDIEEGRTLMSPEEVSIGSIWKTAKAEVMEITSGKHFKIVEKHQSMINLKASIDREKISNVFKQLLLNAILYSEEGATIEVNLSEADGRIRFEIKDTGIGIPKQEQEHIFKKFYRATNVFKKTTEQTGVGLFIAKHYIEQHEGSIGFISEENEGSTFWFELPGVL